MRQFSPITSFSDYRHTCDDTVAKWRPDDDSPTHVNHDCAVRVKVISLLYIILGLHAFRLLLYYYCNILVCLGISINILGCVPTLPFPYTYNMFF